MQRGRHKGTPKTGGRVKGTPNKIPAGLRKKYQQYMEENFDEFIGVLQTLKDTSPKDYARAWNDMANKVLPSLQSVTAEIESAESSSLEDELRELAEQAEE